MNKLRAFAAVHGYWPGTNDDEHLEFLAAQDERIVRANRRLFARADPPKTE